MQDLINSTNIIDSFRHIEPYKLVITNHHHSTSKRLDRIYISEHLHERLYQFNIHRSIIKSTHDATSIIITPVKDIIINIGPKRFIFEDKLLPIPEPNHIIQPFMTSGIDTFISRARGYGLKMKKFEFQLYKSNSPLANQSHQEEPTQIMYKTLNSEFKGSRTQKEYIHVMSNDQETTTSSMKMLNMTYRYMQDLYTNPLPHYQPNYIEEYIEDFPIQLTPNQSLKLERKITSEEILKALFRIDNKKSPGPDGLTVNFYKHNWDIIAPYITNQLNKVMTSGILPYSMQEVMIRIIPKPKKKSNHVKDFRPIALTNILTRILSSIINDRFRELHDTLILPSQRGFLKERQIDENIMEFYNILDLTTKQHSPQLQLLMLDLNKAFDRISHEYIYYLLQKIKVGKYMRRLILSTVTQLRASIILNNFQSPSFKINIGILQGLSFSPVLFNLCLEPFFHKLKRVTQGLSLRLSQHINIQIQYQSFADDMNIYMNTTEEQENVMRELRLFEIATNSKISEEKTNLYYYSSTAPSNNLPFEQLSIQTQDFKYLGIEKKGTNWDKQLGFLSHMIPKSLIEEWPITYSTIAINSYIYSKIYYRELHQPMSEKALDKFNAKLSKKFYGIDWDTIITPQQLGGYGLLDLKHQLMGRKATLIYQLLTSTNTTPTIIMFRFKIQYVIHYMISKSDLEFNNKIKTIPWYSVLMGMRIHRPDIEDFYATFQYHEHFTQSERSILQAWFSLVYTKHPNTNASFIEIDQHDLRSIITRPPDPMLINRYLMDLDEQPLKPTTFTSTSTKHYLRQNKPIAAELISYEFGLTTAHWLKYWKFQKKLKFTYSGEIEELHRFHLGHCSYLGSKTTKEPHPQYPNKHVPFCLLCLDQSIINPGSNHIYQDCEVSKKIWKHFSPDQHFILRNIIGTTHLNPNTYLTVDRYIKTITFLWKTRRRYKRALRPLTDKKIRSIIKTVPNVIHKY
ncbi:uncharacterized protein J8A68_001541 [[Candida] subhashii]|uniref:Reverse transcriptase domain-containing protein n=1 Tax=[Candida] subhashii TaxID=561895 RepID=A0A8J5QMU8_9ASCO|nr:uncharacterized protein J8A68_001541 [[Candida] subhashii]KAG7664903.1 hypothetical protein J8A68_001541 [[Candida] subhashii]